MFNVEIYCLSHKYFSLLDKLPEYIKPLGLGNNTYPAHWLNDKQGENISHLHEHYGEGTGIYWIWKNKLKNMNANDWIGTCHYRRFWLNKLYNNKQKLSVSSLYSNLLKLDNKIFSRCDSIQIQPTTFKNETIFQQFNKIHGPNILNACINFLEINERDSFSEFLYGNNLSHTIFITKVHLFEKYCESLFPWLKKCYEYCIKNDLCKGYNSRLPAFLMERYASYWLKKNTKNKEYLSYARIGNLMRSNNLNKFINPMKIPFTFRMYPTLHRY